MFKDIPHSRTLGQEVPGPILHFSRILVALTSLCIGAEILAQRLFHLAYPYVWPLMPRGDFFRDFHLYRTRFALFHTAAFFTFQGPPYLYPAPPAVFYRLFYLFPRSTLAFLAAFFVAILIAALLFARALLTRHLALSNALALIAVVLLCSYPFAFEYEQANLEWIVCLFVTFGIWTFLKGHGYTSAACFGIAAAMKIYPLIFFGLFLARKQYRQTVCAVFTCAFATLASLWLVCPDLAVSWRGTQDGIAGFRQLYILQYVALEFDHSLFAVPKAVLGVTKFIQHRAHPPGPDTLASILSVYLPVAALTGIVLYFARIRRLPIVNQVLCLTIASILLPPVSFDYTLIHLYAPWALLVLFALEARTRLTPGLSAAFACFAILFAPESEFILHGHGLGGQIKAVTLVVLLVVALRHRFPSSFDALAPPNLNPAT